MLLQRLIILIVVIVICIVATIPLAGKIALLGIGLSIANGGLHGRLTPTIDTIAGSLILIGIIMGIFSFFLK